MDMRRHRGIVRRAAIALGLALGVGMIAAPAAACSLGYVPDLTEVAQRSRFIALVDVMSKNGLGYDVRVIDVVVGDARPGDRITVGRRTITDSCDLRLEPGRRMVLAAEDRGFLDLSLSWAWQMSRGRVVGLVDTNADSLVDLLADLERRAMPNTDMPAGSSLSSEGAPGWLALVGALGAVAWIARRRSLA